MPARSETGELAGRRHYNHVPQPPASQAEGGAVREVAGASGTAGLTSPAVGIVATRGQVRIRRKDRVAYEVSRQYAFQPSV